MAETEQYVPRQIIERMEEIVRNEMLDYGYYVSDEIERPDLAEIGAVCGGRRACAVGSLYLAAGIKPIVREYDDEPIARLPGTDPSERLMFMMTRPALRTAYEALNDAANEYIDREGIEVNREPDFYGAHSYHGDLEVLFETGDPAIGRDELLTVTARAKELV